MPVVPRIDKPPTMPRRPLSVFAASASPPGIEISTSASAARPAAAATSAMASLIMRRGTGLMAGSPGGNRQAGARDRADAFAGAKCHASPGGADTNGGADQRAVGHVGIVAGVLDHAGRRRAFVLARHGERKARPLAARQCHLDRIGKLAGDERGEGRLRRRRGAGAGGPAPAQGRDLLGHSAPFAPSFSPARRGRHDGFAS